jgi:hypothetical protein
MLLKEILKNKKFQKEEKDTTWYRELGKEMTGYFKRNCYWLPYRYEQWKLRSKFKEYQTLPKEKKNWKYFLGMLKK